MPANFTPTCAVSISLRARTRSARSRSAFVTAASRSTAAVVIGGESTGSIFTVQTLRSAVSKMSSRSRSSTCLTAVSAMMSCSRSDATSACAETRSSGGDWPTSTFALFTRTSSCARSTADWRAATVSIADTRFQYALFTSAVV